MSVTTIPLETVEKYLDYYVQHREGDATILQMTSFKSAVLAYCQDSEAELDNEVFNAEFKNLGDDFIVQNYGKHANRAYRRYCQACDLEKWEEATEIVVTAYQCATNTLKTLAREKAAEICSSEAIEITRFDLFVMRRELEALKENDVTLIKRAHQDDYDCCMYEEGW